MTTLQAQLPADVLQELKALHEDGRGLAGNTPKDDPKRKAGEAFCALAARTINEYGVTPTALSLALGLSRSNVYLRLGRHGYIPNPPSQPAYKGTGIGSNTGKGKRLTAEHAGSAKN